MSDFEDRLRSEVTRHADEFLPSTELPELIHDRVNHRRQQRRRLQASALSAAALALAGPALALAMLRPFDDSSTTETYGGDFPPKTATTRPTTSSTASETTPSTSGGEPPPDITGTTEEGTPVEPPPTSSAPPATGTTATTTSPDLKPPDASQPTAGVCGPATEAVVEMVINVDVPDPRCVQVAPAQRLQVRNNTQEQITVSLADFSATLGPGQSQVFDRPFGDYLQPGVHNITSSPYPAGQIMLAA